MKKIVFQDGFAFLYFNSIFYNKDTILKTIEIYKDFGDFFLNELGNYYILKIVNSIEYDLEEVSSNFMNYVLSLEYQGGEV